MPNNIVTAGLDIGHQNVKGVLLGEQGIMSSITLRLSGEVDASAKVAYEKLLTQGRVLLEFSTPDCRSSGGRHFADSPHFDAKMMRLHIDSDAKT